MRKLPGYFYATSREGGAIETLRTIRWTQKRLLYVGPAYDGPAEVTR
jgi:hypothetical protein